MWKEIGKGILKNAATAYGTRVLVERVVPAVEGLGSKVAKKMKALKDKVPSDESSDSEDAAASEGDSPKFKSATTKVVSRPSKIVDAEVED